MGEPAKKPATYEDLYTLPENVTGEIVDGELFATPRPSSWHTHAASVLGIEVGPAYHLGRGGPGGWVILHETEILLGENLLVPDLAGWKRERFPGAPKENWISVSPDWVCEVLSPRTARLDKVRKMPVCARHAVPHLWLVDPAARTLDVFTLFDGKWLLGASFAEDDTVRAEPFAEIAFDLKNLWLDEAAP